MTREEAIKIISNYDVNGCGYCHQGGEEIEEAFDLAIKSLEAWDMVNNEIDKKRNSGQWSDAVIYGLDMAVRIIMKHLGEVEE